ncbi:MAG: hypothetical protein ACYCO3_05160 [Mycobacteriales bacterium]
MKRLALRALEAGLWWGIAFGIWLLSLSALSGQEITVAALVSLPCGVIAVAARLVTQHSWGLRSAWLRPALWLPLAIVTDSAQVFASVFRRNCGEFRRVSVSEAVGHGPGPQGRRAFATFFVSVTPGSYVADIDPETGEALVHVLSKGGPSMVKAATR